MSPYSGGWGKYQSIILCFVTSPNIISRNHLISSETSNTASHLDICKNMEGKCKMISTSKPGLIMICEKMSSVWKNVQTVGIVLEEKINEKSFK